jgi:hypothetical protein
MAVRYSGDVELRIRWSGDAYEVTVRAPRVRGRGTMTLQELGLARKASRDVSSSETYDEVARRILDQLEGEHGTLPLQREGGQIVVSRLFVSPCPRRSL